MLNVETRLLEGRREFMTKEATTRVVLADDHDVVRQGLKRLLNRAPEIEVVGEASDGLEALNFVKELRPDVLLLDIEMPVMDGIEVARRLQELNLKVRILILSAYDDREYIRALLDIGVSGYLVKGEAPGKIVEAVRGVAQGQKGWVSPQIRKKLEKMQDPVSKQAELTYRDLEILRLLAAGKSDAVISEKIGAGEFELSALIQALMQKIGAGTRQEAVEISIREGWISGADR
jgi:two-component system, NarL family, response regulator LiaR